MKKNERVPGEFVTSVTVAEILISTGIQLVQWANQIAFTDAAFGANWSVDTADRMACLSQLLNNVYKGMPEAIRRIKIELPDGMMAQVQINEMYEPESEEASSDDEASTTDRSGGNSSIGDFPF